MLDVFARFQALRRALAAPDTPGVIAPPPLIALGVVVLGLLLDWLFPAYLLQVMFGLDTRIVVGVVLVAAGASLGFAAVREFGSARTNVEPWKPSTTLVTGGIFRWLRNPMYVGGMLILGGLAFAFGSDWMLVLLFGAFFLIDRGVVKREEAYLGAKFGEAYLAYRRAVPRYGWPRVTDLR